MWPLILFEKGFSSASLVKAGQTRGSVPLANNNYCSGRGAYAVVVARDTGRSPTRLCAVTVCPSYHRTGVVGGSGLKQESTTDAFGSIGAVQGFECAK